MRRQKSIVALALILGASAAFVSCSDDDNPTNPSQTTGRVLIAHASPDAPAVDIVVDGGEAAADLTFPNNTGYVALSAGTRNVKVNAANTTTTVINADLGITDGGNYTVFACDSLSRITALVLVDDLSAPATGKAHVRFVHLSPNAPAVDITTNTGAVVFGNRTFKQFTPFTPLDAGTVNLQVRAAGTSNVVLNIGNVTFTAGKIYTVFARGFLGGAGAQALGAQIIANN